MDDLGSRLCSGVGYGVFGYIDDERDVGMHLCILPFSLILILRFFGFVMCMCWVAK